MNLLALDASTYTGTVAVVAGTRVVARASAAMRGRDAERLMPAVEEALRSAGLRPGSLQGIVCGGGPGSFTSLRIAASIAKGIAVGAQLPLFAVSSLGLMVAAHAREDGRYLATLDALRGESYAELFEVSGGMVRQVEPTRRVANEALAALAGDLGARLVGPGHPDGWTPDAAGVVRFADVLEGRATVDLASWEPNYGRQAEAQAKWEAAHGRSLPA